MSFVTRMRQFFERGSHNNHNNTANQSHVAATRSPTVLQKTKQSVKQNNFEPSSHSCVVHENLIGVAQAKLIFEQQSASGHKANLYSKKGIGASNLSMQSTTSKSKFRLFKFGKHKHKKSQPVFEQYDESETCCEDHLPEEKKNVELRLKDEESRYDKRMKYQSILGDAPLYQTLSNGFLGDSKRISLFADTDQIKENIDPDVLGFSLTPSFCEGHSGTVHTDDCQFLNTMGPGRKMWADMKQVRESDIFNTMKSEERSLYEARFEIITSESSYHRSLMVLIDSFYKAPEFDCSQDDCVISAYQKQHIFSNILEIAQTSESFLNDLEKVWLRDICLNKISNVVYHHAVKKFHPYVSYLRNQHAQLETVQRVMRIPRICDIVERLQKDPACGLLNFHSFLILPMQRITRLRLLVQAVLDRMHEDDPAYTPTLKALSSVEQVLNDCETQKRLMEQKSYILQIFVSFDFSPGVPLVSSGNRVLVKDGDLRVVDTGKNAPAIFRKRNFRSRNRCLQARVYLFSDVLIIARQKKDGRYLVEDTCPRGALFVSAQGIQINWMSMYYDEDANNSISNNNFDCSSCNFRLVLLEGVKGHTDYTFETSSVEECGQWLEVLAPKRSENNERNYEKWDHPTHIVNKPYVAQQDDEIDLYETDIVDVFCRLPNGMLRGVLRNGNEGWFPEGYTVELDNDYVRRRNKKILLMNQERNKLRRKS